MGFTLSITGSLNVGTKNALTPAFQSKLQKLFPVGFSGLSFLCAFQGAEHTC